MAVNKKEVKKPAAPKVTLPAEVQQDEQADTVQEAAAGQVKKRHPGPWTKMSEEDIVKHSIAGNLIGHDPKTGEVILVDEADRKPFVDQSDIKAVGFAQP